MKKNLAVLFGGCSSEYPVSLKSACSVLESIDSSKYDVIPVGITQDGQWFRFYGDYEEIAEDTWHRDLLHLKRAFLSPDRSVHGLGEITEKGLHFTWLDAVFPVLHGKNGEDGSVQGLAELAGIPVIGCGVLASALSMDKHRAHQIVSLAGIKVPKSVYFDHRPTEQELTASCKDLRCPLFVKPLRAGSSFGITKIADLTQLADAAEEAFRHDTQILIEENVEGFEVGCAVLGNENLTLGRVDEVELDTWFFDYEEKYTQQHARIHMPARIDANTETRVQDAAAKIYRALDCKGFARVDMFLTPENDIVFNEVNTIPGCTSLSRYPKMLAGAGLSYSDVINTLIQLEMPK